jgi:hypothetical protein
LFRQPVGPGHSGSALACTIGIAHPLSLRRQGITVKKKGRKPVPSTDPCPNCSKILAILLELDPATHQRLLDLAAEQGKSMSAFVRDLVDQALARGNGGTSCDT